MQKDKEFYMTKRYKFLRTGFKSDSGNHKWKVGEWYTYDGELKMCERGFHCSKGIYQAFSYVQGEILAEVEVKGKHLSENNKEVWQKMRAVRVWKWKKKDSVLFAIYAAKLVLKEFEDRYPDDKRPREAIEAAQKYADHPTKKNAAAAWDAWDAEAAAWAAARAAARAAEAAINKKLDLWMLKHLDDMKLFKP